MTDFVDPEALLQIGLAVAYGGAIGLERERRGRAAGLRTVILVCLGATVIMIVSAKVASIGGYDPDTTRVDPGRIAAGIVTGIGFLGAGVVIRLGDLVRGVTTAATIWFTAGLGIAIGSGAYGLATVATVTALVVLWSFNGIERLVRAPVYRVVVLEVAVEHGKALEHQARLLIEGGGARVMDTRANLDVEEGISTLQLHVRAPPKFGVRDLVESLGGEAGVRRAAWE